MKNIIVITACALAFLAPIAVDALTVGPVKLEFLVDKGETLSGTVMLQNEEDALRTFYPSFEAFTEDGGQKIFLKEESGLSQWVETATSVTLQPLEEKRIPFTIRVPQDAASGSHFAVMWWGTAPTAGSGERVSIVTRAGILMYLTVAGDLHEQGSLVAFNSGDRSLFWDFPVPFHLSFENQGNVYLKPNGSIRITSMWGSLKKILVFNEYGSQILPGKTKSFAFTIHEGDGFYFGPYKATLQASYGSNKTLMHDSFWIWIFPIPWLVKIVVGLLLIFFAIPHGVKRYNRWIIRKSMNQGMRIQGPGNQA